MFGFCHTKPRKKIQKFWIKNVSYRNDVDRNKIAKCCLNIRVCRGEKMDWIELCAVWSIRRNKHPKMIANNITKNKAIHSLLILLLLMYEQHLLLVQKQICTLHTHTHGCWQQKKKQNNKIDWHFFMYVWNLHLSLSLTLKLLIYLSARKFIFLIRKVKKTPIYYQFNN